METHLFSRIMTSALLIFIGGKLNAQDSPQPWAWAKAIYGTNFFESPWPGPSIAVDPSSKAVYTTGSYTGTVDFDPGIDIFNLDSEGIYADMFISKLDGNGHFVWARQISPPAHNGSCRGYSIAVDASGSGDIYTTGCFHGQVDFDPGPGTFTLEYSGYAFHNPDIFITKLDSSGNFKWATRIGGTGDDAYGRSIIFDPLGKGSVYILGAFTGTIDFNPTGGSCMLTSVGAYDFFVAKLDRSGQFLWAKAFGGIKDDIGFGMTVDPKHGDIYITGGFTGEVNFNPSNSSHILTSGPFFDTFILKLDSTGNFVWVKPMFGSSSSKGGTGYAIAIDPDGSGEIYTTGYFDGKVDFNPDGKGFFYLDSKGNNDVFISKLSSSGDFIWAKAIGGVGDDKGNAIVFDPIGDGGVYVMGNFAQTADLNPGEDTFHLTSIHGNDLFIAKLNSKGEFEWAKSIFAKNANQGSALAFDGQFLYTTGIFLNPTISFPPLVVTNPIDSEEFWNVFIAKLNTTSTTSVAEIKYHPFNLYPNPADNELTIDPDVDEFINVDVTIFNILGEVVFYSPVENIGLKKTIDISTLSTGVYFIQLNIDGKSVTQKIVKE